MYLIANPKTLAVRPVIFKARKEAEEALALAIETYGLTTDFVVCKVIPVKGTIGSYNVHLKGKEA